MAFEDEYFQTVVSPTVRNSTRFATIDPGNGTECSSGVALLRHVLDV